MQTFKTLLLITAFSLFISPGLKAQQASDVAGCMDAFYDALLTWDTEASTSNRSVVCQVINGKASVEIGSQSAYNGSVMHFVDADFIRGSKGLKQCLVRIVRHGHDPRVEEVARYSLEGSNGSAWNRFLKTTGCQDAHGMIYD